MKITCLTYFFLKKVAVLKMPCSKQLSLSIIPIKKINKLDSRLPFLFRFGNTTCLTVLKPKSKMSASSTKSLMSIFFSSFMKKEEWAKVVFKGFKSLSRNVKHLLQRKSLKAQGVMTCNKTGRSVYLKTEVLL